MKVNKKLLISLLLVSFSATVAGAYSVLRHDVFGDWILTVALILNVLTVLLSFLDILGSGLHSKSEKVIWSVAVLLGGLLGVCLYLFLGNGEAALFEGKFLQSDTPGERQYGSRLTF